MNSDFILKVRGVFYNLERITIQDLQVLQNLQINLLKEIEKTITGYPEIGQRQLISNFNEILTDYRFIHKKVMDRLDELRKKGQNDYSTEYRNTRGLALRCEDSLRSLLQLLLDYFPEKASQNKIFYEKYYPSLLVKLPPKQPATNNQQPENYKQELPERLLSFSKPEISELIFEELKGYFPGKEEDLIKALKGEKIEKPLLFPHNQNKLVEVFRRAKYNGYIPNTFTELRDWLCENFIFRYKKGELEEIRSFNRESVYSILTRGRGEPTKNERICIVDWLPFKSQSQLQNKNNFK